MASKQNKSFTLIEMLIVVVIIGILAAALIPRLQSVQARARDTKRKADLHQIGTALEIYKEDNGDFTSLNPLHLGGRGECDWSWQIPSAQNDITPTIARYMTSVPSDTTTAGWDPNPDCMGQYNGYFLGRLSKGSRDWQAFILVARMESDGMSSNWVTNSSNMNNSDDAHNPGWDSNGQWDGFIEGGNTYGNDAVSLYTIYSQNACEKVAFTGGDTANFSGACSANKDGNDLRYIYVQ